MMPNLVAGSKSPVTEQWHRAMRQLATIRTCCRWVACIATGCCVGVLFSSSQPGWFMVLVMVAFLAWTQASSADSQIKILESLRAKYGLRSEHQPPAA